MKFFNNVVKNSLYLGIGQGISGLLYFLATVYLARELGAGKFGIFSFAESVFMFFSLVAIWGSDFIGAREIAKAEEKDRQNIVTQIISMRLTFSLVAFVLLVIFTLLIKNSIQTKIMVFICGLALFSLVFLLDWFYWGLERYYLYVQYSIFRDLFFLLGVLFLVHINKNILGIGVVFFLSKLISSLYLVVYFVRKHYFFNIKWNFLQQKVILASCSMIFLATLVGWVVHFFDITLISIIYDEKMTGYYSAAYKPLFFLVMGMIMYMKAIFPILVKSKEVNIGEFRNIIVLTLYVSILLILPIAIAGARYGKQLIEIIYKGNFIESVNAFRVLVFVLFLFTINTTYSRGLIASGKEKDNFVGNSIVAISNILLNLCLVPAIGIIGAAWSKVGAECIGFYYYHKKLSQVIQIPLSRLIMVLLLVIFFSISIFWVFHL